MKEICEYAGKCGYSCYGTYCLYIGERSDDKNRECKEFSKFRFKDYLERRLNDNEHNSNGIHSTR